MPPLGRYVGSPHDTDARYATKGATVWSGYKMHLTETCDDGSPDLITHVETKTAAVSDNAVALIIHAALEVQGLLPTTHVADTGFVNSALFVDRDQARGRRLPGVPVPAAVQALDLNTLMSVIASEATFHRRSRVQAYQIARVHALASIGRFLSVLRMDNIPSQAIVRYSFYSIK